MGLHFGGLKIHVKKILYFCLFASFKVGYGFSSELANLIAGSGSELYMKVKTCDMVVFELFE